MTSRKLSDSDKQHILELYRNPGETTSTLASRYGVSNSTISRILKTSFSESEYEVLIQQKRSTRTTGNAVAAELEEVESEGIEPVAAVESGEAVPVAEAQPEMPLEPPLPVQAERRSRKRLSIAEVAEVEPEVEGAEVAPITAIASEPEPVAAIVEPEPVAAIAEAEPVAAIVEPEPVAAIIEEVVSTNTNGDFAAEASAIQEILSEELLDQEEDLEDLDLDLDEDEDLDDEFDDGLPEGPLLLGSRGSKMLVQVLPITEASIPRTCYLVVDRSSELIARPLQEFGDLGQIPATESLSRTLPVFDNHRVAKRFSNPRTQRVIKLPDGKVLQKTSSHLQAKGITRLLIDGQVYSLPPSGVSVEVGE